MSSSIEPCKFCRFCVPDDAVEGRCHKESPVMLRGSDMATWPRVKLDAPGCGKFKAIGSDPA